MPPNVQKVYSTPSARSPFASVVSREIYTYAGALRVNGEGTDGGGVGLISIGSAAPAEVTVPIKTSIKIIFFICGSFLKFG